MDFKWPLHLLLIAERISTFTYLNTKKSCSISNRPEYKAADPKKKIGLGNEEQNCFVQVTTS